MGIHSRPSVEEIYDLLSKRSALIVHFSGTPPGAGSSYDRLFPDDLNEVIRGACHGGLSCSTVMPSDQFSTLEKANSTGCIGVVLGLKTGQSIMDAHRRDCGSYVENHVRQVPNARDLSLSDLEATINDRASDSYNEWVVGDYCVLGIFAIEPFYIWAEVAVEYPPEMPDYLRSSEPSLGIATTNLQKLRDDFPGQEIFSFKNGGIVKLVDGVWKPTGHEMLYS